MRKLPFNENYEKLILGSILNSSDASNSCFICLQSSDFYIIHHISLFEEFKRLYAKCGNLDILMIFENLKLEDKDFDYKNYILNLVQIAPTAIDLNYYCKELRNFTSLRKLIDISRNTIVNSFKNETSCENLIKNLFNDLFKIQGLKFSKTQSTRNILDKFSEHGNFEHHLEWMLDRVSNNLTPYSGVPSNYEILDKTLGFFRNSALYYIGARTSMGKTTFMLNLINGILSKDLCIPICVFSLEMPAQIISAKLICMMANVKYSDLEDMKISNKQLNSIKQSADTMRDAKLFIDDDEDITISSLRSKARSLVINEGVKIIFIDYLTRIKSDTKYPSKHLQVDEISKSLQSMAKELNVPVVCLCQLNRAMLNRNDKIPTLADFRESGSLEEDCDAAILIHRPDYYDPYDKPGKIEILIAKNRIRGQLKTIQFSKNDESEKYYESEDLGVLKNKILKLDQEFINPFEDL